MNMRVHGTANGFREFASSRRRATRRILPRMFASKGARRVPLPLHLRRGCATAGAPPPRNEGGVATSAMVVLVAGAVAVGASAATAWAASVESAAIRELTTDKHLRHRTVRALEQELERRVDANLEARARVRAWVAALWGETASDEWEKWRIAALCRSTLYSARNAWSAPSAQAAVAALAAHVQGGAADPTQLHQVTWKMCAAVADAEERAWCETALASAAAMGDPDQRPLAQATPTATSTN
jgi:hypothetical protein